MKSIRYLLAIILISSIFSSAKSQNHVAGLGLGTTRRSTIIYLDYQFNYKIFNSKVKCSLFPEDFKNRSLRSMIDLYVGLKTKDGNFITCYFNFGGSFYNPNKSLIIQDANQQINPILNFECAFTITENIFFTTGISIYQLQILIPQKTGEYYKKPGAYTLLEMGITHKFNIKKNKKEISN